MATIHVDGKEYEVNGADNLLQACLSLGLDIPFLLAPGAGKRRCLPPVCGEAIPKRGRYAWSPGDVLYDASHRRYLYLY